MARECYSASMKQKAIDSIYVDELDMRDQVNTRTEPSEELEPIQLDDHLEHRLHWFQARGRPQKPPYSLLET